MEKTDCIAWGEILKAHGYRGELVLGLSRPAGVVPAGSAVFIDIDGGLVPFFLTGMEDRDDRCVIIALEDIDSEKKARALQGKQVFLLKDQPVQPAEAHHIIDLKGFEVIDLTLGSLGKVEEMLELPMHTLLRISGKKPEQLLPLHENLIVSIDSDKKVMVMNLPEGLESIDGG